jgi:hypothetical protein
MFSDKTSTINNNSNEELSKNNEDNNENFYDICIQAVESNNDKMLDKEECIKGINQLKYNSKSRRSLSNRANNKKLEKNIISSQKSITQKCIDEILEESKNKIDIINIHLQNNKKNNIQKLSNKNINNNNNINNNKKISPNKKNIIGKDKNLTHFFKGKQRRYTVLKHINEYLESNDVTMNELIENNPFQDKPYHITGSYEFLQAVKFGNFDYVNEALIKNGIFLFVIDYYGQTGYHWAAKLGNIKMLDLLIKVGRHHNQKDFKGRTPLYLAAVNNNKEVCQFLLANGANPFLSDKDGKTPADVAGSSQLREYIKDNMTQPFSNPLYQAKIKRILQDRDKHINKEGQKKNAKNLNFIMNLFKGKK